MSIDKLKEFTPNRCQRDDIQDVEAFDPFPHAGASEVEQQIKTRQDEQFLNLPKLSGSI